MSAIRGLFENQSFEGIHDSDSRACFADMEFRSCYFQGCTLSITRSPSLRSTVRNIRFEKCSQRGCSIDAAVIEEVTVDGVTTHGQLLQTWGAVFKHVTLKGKIDRLMISQAIRAGLAEPEEQAAFDNANAEYYRGVDWALDISQGEFKELELRGLPARLIRRDPETQIVVTREKALQGEWRDLEFKEALTPFAIGRLLEGGGSDRVMVAGKRHRKFRRYLDDFNLLRKAGIAEPD